MPQDLAIGDFIGSNTIFDRFGMAGGTGTDGFVLRAALPAPPE